VPKPRACFEREAEEAVLAGGIKNRVRSFRRAQAQSVQFYVNESVFTAK